MGNIQSSDYRNIDGKPVVAPVVKIWSEGEEVSCINLACCRLGENNT